MLEGTYALAMQTPQLLSTAEQTHIDIVVILIFATSQRCVNVQQHVVCTNLEKWSWGTVIVKSLWQPVFSSLQGAQLLRCRQMARLKYSGRAASAVPV